MTRFSFDSLAARDRRAVTLGLVILVPALLFVFVVRPYRAALADVRDQLATQRALLGRELAVLDEAPRLPDAVRVMAEEVDRAEERLLRAENTALAEAELTRHIERSAVESRVLLQEVRALPLPRDAEYPEGVQPIRLAVRGESDTQGVVELLRRIEEHTLLVNVADLSIQAPEEEQNGRRRSSGRQDPMAVRQFSMVIEGYAVTRGS